MIGNKQMQSPNFQHYFSKDIPKLINRQSCVIVQSREMKLKYLIFQRSLIYKKIKLGNNRIITNLSEIM